MRYLFFAVLLFSFKAFSQCKTYSLDEKRDTINCIDSKVEKQGKWIIRTEKLRGEPGFAEIGYYQNDKKEGKWTKYSLAGDVLAIENYRWGFKNGISEYYNLAGLLRKESWKAIDPENPYDTVDVYDLIVPDKITQKVVKVDASTIKSGVWEYFDPINGTIVNTEEYQLDALVDPRKKAIVSEISDSSEIANADTLIKNKAKPLEVLQYEKKNSNKKKIKVREGQTGVD